jgi:nicotinamidase-related amidase
MTNATTTALLVGHIQPPISLIPMDQSGYFSSLQSILSGARDKGVQVIYLNLGFIRGYPEFPADSPVRGEIGGISDAVDERVAPLDSDIEVVSPGPDIFARSSLASILRAKGITSIAVAGVSTGGIVNGVVVGGYCEGLDVVVLKDLCYEPGEGNSEPLFTAFTRPWGATVTTSAEWLSGIKAAASAP